MRAGETMQINRDGNFLIPQVDGPADLLLSGDDEENDKIDLTEDPVLENQEDSQVVNSASMEQNADATPTEDPVLENREDSQVADAASMEQDADATSTEDPVLENQEDSQVADAASMKQDMNEASAEEAQVRLEITGMDPIEASEEASMPDAMKLPENDEN